MPSGSHRIPRTHLSSADPWNRRTRAARVRRLTQVLRTRSPAALDDVELIINVLSRAVRHRAAGDFTAANALEQLVEVAMSVGGVR